jgi:signal transduction histidine kinase/ActR/RegA family two-component response regulator
MESAPAATPSPVSLTTIFGGASVALFDSIFDLYGLLYYDGMVIDLKGRIFERTKTDPELLVGQPFAQTVFWQSAETTSRIVEKEIKDCAAGRPTRLIVDFRISADERSAVDLRLIPLEPDLSEGLIFVYARSIDPDETQAAENVIESEQLLFAAKNAEIGLWFWDFQEGKIHSTPTCNELLELPASEQISYETFINLVHPADREYVSEFIENSRSSGSRYEGEFRVCYSDGSVEWLSAQGRSFFDSGGQPERMVGVVRKITEQKLAADQLAKVYDRERKARDEAVEANRAKDLFLAFVSHEIRSSLNAIIGWTQILLTKEVDEATRRNALETIERSARSQTKLINDLVDSARVASGKIRLEYRPTNICDVVRGSFEAQRPSAEANRIDYRFSADSEANIVFGDSARLQQVFANLISNAIKFTPQGGMITVDLRTGAETVTITVTDNGKGIEKTSLPTIFRQFSQVENNAGEGNSGLGLGLSIVKILVERHGGGVLAESEGIGKGSAFTITLPLSTGEKPVIASSQPIGREKSQSLDGLTILIVEDDDDSREVLQMFLEKSGANVMTANSARSAFEILGRSRSDLPDLMISDLAMSDEDGYALITRIRKLSAELGGTTPAIALSAFANEESRRRAFEAGFQKYATKPFDHDLLVADILDVIERGPLRGDA